MIEIERLDASLASYYHYKFQVEDSLTRQLVSFQASKAKPIDRWYKYKEAFSVALVQYLFQRYKVKIGKILDPFAGSGSALFAASAAGLDADGIELLPIGQQIITARLLVEREFLEEDLVSLVRWEKSCPWRDSEIRQPLSKIRITDGAYPPETVEAIERYMGAWQHENERVQALLRFALLCVLESVSYTRRDGQYLRWDDRSKRRLGKKPFDKGKILEFDEAITAKLREIESDARLVAAQKPTSHIGTIHLYCGSSLIIAPQLESSSFDAIMTSPPYCNRYDYTRTYALELALLGASEHQIVNLRQQMLSSTVENRAKDLMLLNPNWGPATQAADDVELLQYILRYLDDLKTLHKLNNNGIPRMVRGYFYEMACIIFECSRLLKPGAPMFMVNDNVRYAGASVSVDMILSNIAEKFGFDVESILVLPKGKGNSSQQMGEHGRASLRKCVYVWRKK